MGTQHEKQQDVNASKLVNKARNHLALALADTAAAATIILQLRANSLPHIGESGQQSLQDVDDLFARELSFAASSLSSITEAIDRVDYRLGNAAKTRKKTQAQQNNSLTRILEREL